MQSLLDYGLRSVGFTCWRGACRSTALSCCGLGLGDGDMPDSPNKPAAGNAGIASQLTIGHHWPGVPEPGRR